MTSASTSARISPNVKGARGLLGTGGRGLGNFPKSVAHELGTVLILDMPDRTSTQFTVVRLDQNTGGDNRLRLDWYSA